MTLRKYNSKSAKLSDIRAKEMYDRIRSGELTQGEACKIYRLGIVQVGRIARGESRAQVTGAHDDPVGNFNLQITQADIDASITKLQARLNAKPPSLYDSPPPTEDEDQATAERAMEQLNERLKPTAKQQQVSDGLDELEKGD
jgi:hypothetical protein